MSYMAKVIMANDISPHPTGDRLNILRYNSEQFVIGKDIQIGDTVVLFPTDGKLSVEFCSENNLFRDATKNKNPLKTGFFEEQGRVRSQPFRGQKSYGFVATPSMFEYTGKFNLSVGDEFDTLNGHKICEKYYSRKTLERMSKIQGKKERDVEYTMKEHIDSKKFSYYIPIIDEPSFVMISEKVHGTSARTSYSKVIRRNSGWTKKLISFFTGKKFETVEYEHVSGTRRTIINNRLDVTTEGQEDYYRWEIHQKIAPQLHKGEAIYYEIVGYNSNGGTIMETQDLQKVKKENVAKPSWRNPMIYSYGLPEGERDVYVYRITRTTDDGTETELSWYQVEGRCRELGLKTVPVLEKVVINNTETLVEKVAGYMTDDSSTLDDRHLMEGVVIRIENSKGVEILKEKNWLFGVLESYIKEDDNVVDVEEVN